jgi:hypothetical protein
MAKQITWIGRLLIGAGIVLFAAAGRGYAISSDNNIVGLVVACVLALVLVLIGLRCVPVANIASGGDKTEHETSPSSSVHEVIIGILRGISYACLLVWPAFLVGSFMAFDAPGSERHYAPWLFVAFVLLLPLLIFIMPNLAKSALAKGRVKRAYALAITPIAPFVLPVIFFQWIQPLLPP